MIHCRIPTSVRIRKATPERKTAPSAVSHGTPMPLTTVYVKYAFSPMPGASAIGYRANAPIRIVANAADRHVAANTAGNRHARVLENRGIHEHDVRHRDERRESGQNLRLPVRLQALKLEISLQSRSDLSKANSPPK